MNECEEYYQMMLDRFPKGNKWLWIARAGNSMSPLQVVHEVISQLNASGCVVSLQECEVRAYCARYRHYKGDGVKLSSGDLEYTSGCEGVLWKQRGSQYWWYVVSLKDYLETRDPGFAGFNNHHEGVDAA